MQISVTYSVSRNEVFYNLNAIEALKPQMGCPISRAQVSLQRLQCSIHMIYAFKEITICYQQNNLSETLLHKVDKLVWSTAVTGNCSGAADSSDSVKKL